MTIRNLRLLWIDDNLMDVPLPEHIDFIDLSGAIVQDTSEVNWEGHCEILAQGDVARLDFDLLSIDLNFRSDDQDPQNKFGKGGNNCSGFYHGMLALARRRPMDRNGNILPLAWAMRTLDPSVFHDPSNKDLMIEATRAFGLLRSLIARPTEESIKDCILREHKAATNVSFPPELPESSLQSVMRWLLTNQPSTGKGGFSTASSLLSQWRVLFYQALRGNQILIDVNALATTIQQLELHAKGSSLIQIADGNYDLSILVSGWGGREKEPYGIRIWSILNDIFHPNDQRKIDISLPDKRLALDDKDHLSVIEWMRALHRTAGASSQPIDLVKRYSTLGRQLHELMLQIRSHDEKARTKAEETMGLLWYSWRDREYQLSRIMLYCLALIREKLFRPRAYAKQSDKALANSSLGLKYNVHMFRRPLSMTNFGAYRKPSELRNALEKALNKEDDELFTRIPWVRDVLRKFATETLQLSNEVVLKRAPGLIT